MKLSIFWLYWTLLFVSSLSSCLLFILVATESIKGDPLSSHYSNVTSVSGLAESTAHADDAKNQRNEGENPLMYSNLAAADRNTLKSDDIVQSQQKEEEVAEIHSSFEDEVLSSSSNGLSNSYIGPHVSASGITKELTETGQAVVFTFVDTASVELQNGASSSSSQRNIEKANTENLTVIESRPPPLPDPPPLPEPPVVQEPTKDDSTKNSSSPEIAALPEIDQQYVVRAEPKVMEFRQRAEEEGEDEVSSEEPPAVASVNLSQLGDDSIGVPSEPVITGEGEPGTAGHVEEVLSFSEWTQKQMEEAEKKKVQNITFPATGSTPKGSGSLKIRSKNFASPDCGAKVVGSNPEAVSAGSVLSPSRDEYVLNACTNRIWFVVELCEAVQARKIELANFELFSSSPRDFSVYVSDRYPSRDWSLIGQFTAKDEKNIQSFNLANHNLFRKYIKLELHSHYGSEHFCPISLFRVYGTSEYEVLEREDEVHESVPSLVDEDDDEEPLDVDTGEPPKTLFGSAQDAVLSIVKKAAQVLVKSGDAENETSVAEPVSSSVRQAEFCQSPSHIIVCDNCSEAMYNSVFEILSCQTQFLQRLMDSPFIQSTLWTSEMCRNYGLDFGNHRTGAPYPLRPATNSNYPIRSDESGYLSALLPPPYVAALCNILAVLEKKVVLNISYEVNNVSSVNLTSDSEEVIQKSDSDFEKLIVSVPSVCSLDSSSFSPSCVASTSESTSSAETVMSSVTSESSSSESSLASQIKPTRTQTKEPDRRNTFHVEATQDPSRDSRTHTSIPEAAATVEPDALPITPASVPEATVVENETGVVTESTDASSSTYLKPESASVLSQDNNSLHMDGDVASSEEQQDSLETLIKELIEVDPNATATEESISISTTTSTTTTVVPPSVQVQKETVFVRLSNRIKALERNMSLSTQYLEQLSLRYKKQVDEMQKMFNRTLLALKEESRKGEEREQRQQEQIEAINQRLSMLTSTVEALLEEKQLSWQNKGMVMMQHLMVILVEVIIFVLVLYLCLRLPTSHSSESQRKWSFGWRMKNQETPRRRRSVEGVSGHACPKPRSRRPSEEALNITGTYQELLINDGPVAEVDSGTGAVPKQENKRRRRKKKESLSKSSSNTNTAQKLAGRRNSEHTNYTSRINGESGNTRRSNSSELCRSWSVGSSAALEAAALVNQREERASADGAVNNVGRVNCEGTQSISQNIQIESQRTSTAVPPLEPSSREQGSRIQEIEIPTVQGNGTVKSIVMNPKVRRLSSPFFMRTAMASRSSRLGLGSERSPQAKLKSDNWEWYVSRRLNSPDKSSQVLLQNGSEHQSNGTSGVDDVDAANAGNPSNSDSETQKDMAKKSGSGSTSGLKRMVRKFF